MKLKLAAALNANGSESLEDLKTAIYSKPGMRIVAVAEFAHVKRLQPAPDEDQEAEVTLGIKLIEVARSGEHAEHLRRAMQALHLQRTARGTLDEQLDELKLTPTTIEQLGDNLAWTEAARLRAALKHVAETMNRLRIGEFSDRERKSQQDKLYRLVQATLRYEDEVPDGD